MVKYSCDKCNKNFNQKCHWIQHTQNKKKPCKTTSILINNNSNLSTSSNFGAGSGENFGSNIISDIHFNNTNGAIICKFCCREFLHNKSLKRHISEYRCKILKLQKQQKENIFVNLVKEDEIKKISNNKSLKFETNSNIVNLQETNKIIILIKEMKKSFEENLEKQKKELENKIKIEVENKLKLEFEKEIKNKFQIDVNKKNSIVLDKYSELEKNNIQLQKLNYRLQNKINKIVLKNKYKINKNNTNSNNTQNITNNVIVNNANIKLVDFGNEDLNKISHNVFIDTIRSQGSGLYNKAIDGIHFNKDYPENQNIYISDFNRDKVMIYKNEKWFLDNWDSVFIELLEKVIQFGYDKNEFLLDCNYKLDGKKFNKQMIKNGMRWYKLLSEDEPDIDYFTLNETERPEIDKETYNDYLEMQEFRKSHPKKQTECNIKNKMKLNIYNKRKIPIENYKKLTLIDISNIKLIE